MKATGQFSIFLLAFGVFGPAALASCGGRATDLSRTGTEAGAGGITSSGGRTGAGGNTSIGGTSATSVVAPRVPRVHRVSALSCDGVYSPPDPVNVVVSEYDTCASHADCIEGVNGKCATSGIGMMGNRYFCSYDTCATDANCDAGKICYCNGTTSARCLSLGNCRVDADCGNGAYSYCSPSMSWDCSGYRPVDGYHCHTASDTCMDDTDCVGTDYCNYDVYDGRWKCTAQNTTCAIG